MIRLLILLFTISSVCSAQSKSKKYPLLIDSTKNLYAFVGQKISLNQYDPNSDYNDPISIEIDSTTGDTVVKRRSYIMDNAFDAKYEIIQAVFNDLKSDTIFFKAFDHYGKPAFEKYSTVLLYVSKSENGNYYFHQKYQFDPLYKEKNNTWVGKNGESLRKLFNKKRKTIFTARGIFQ